MCVCVCGRVQVKDKEAELKSAEQKLHDEFERLRRQNAEEKRLLDDKKRQLVRLVSSFSPSFPPSSPSISLQPPPCPSLFLLAHTTQRYQHAPLAHLLSKAVHTSLSYCTLSLSLSLSRTKRSVCSTRRRRQFRPSGLRPRRSNWPTNNVAATGNER